MLILSTYFLQRTTVGDKEMAGEGGGKTASRQIER